jgi:hypothetical protein
MEADAAGLMDGQRALDPLDEQGTSILFEEESDPFRRGPFFEPPNEGASRRSNRATKQGLGYTGRRRRTNAKKVFPLASATMQGWTKLAFAVGSSVHRSSA